MNQYWINFTLIVSGVIIFLAVVAPSILQIILSSGKDVNEKRNEGKNVRSSVWAPIVFMGTFMVLVGISMFSFRFSDCPMLLDFMSLASAIVSIILAVLTIVYSYYTTSASMKNLGKLEESADTIVETSDQIGKISIQIDKLETMVEELKPYIEKEMQKLGEAFNSVNYDNATKSSDTTPNDNVSFDYTNFITTFSPFGILFLHMCVKCEGKRPEISFQEIAKIFEQNAIQYFMGILVTLYSLFGIPIVEVDYDNSLIIVGQIDNSFKKAIEVRMNELSEESRNIVKKILAKMSVVLKIDMLVESK